MQFEMTEDRRMLAESLGRYLADKYDWETRAKIAYEPPWHSPERWSELVALGVFYAFASEESGGLGGSGFDITSVFEVLGRTICPEPVLPALMAARLLDAAGVELEPLLSGETRYAVATGEIDAPYDLAATTTQARRSNGSWTLEGRKSVVYGGQVADRFLVAARNGEALSVLEVESAAVVVTPYGMIDGGGAAEVFFEGAPARLLIEDGRRFLTDALDAGALALSAEAVGAADATFAATLDYLRTRKQFGRPIGSFQALQHRMVDLKAEIEQARSITILAASRMGTEEQSRTVSMAKNLVGRTAKLVAEEAIQLHGGIAMTWEYPISHYAKRLVMIDHQLGDMDWHLERVMAAYREA
jgi:alkylation response protein AidB-like acyl-CoA dehydrogenase